MLVRLKNAILGGAVLTVPQEFSSELLSICLDMKLPISQTRLSGDSFSVESSYRASGKLISRLKKSSVPFSVKCFGFPFFLWSYRRRPGIYIGLLLAFLIVVLSGRVVWDIRISGNDSLDTASIKQELAAVGFTLGCPTDIDVDRISNSLLARSEDISWLSVNMSGTVAYVQIRQEVCFAQKDRAPCNLVAARDGTVERIESTAGTVCVEAGQSVKKGDLLVSGIRGGNTGNFSLVQASGEIFAITSRDFSVEIPLIYTAEVPVSSKTGDKYIKFFSKNIFFSRNSRNSMAKCVKIYREDNLSPSFLAPLPFGIVSEILTEYKSVEMTRTAKEASDLAFARLYRIMEVELKNADLLSKNITCRVTDRSVLLSCTAVCSENIAISQKINQ